LWRIVCNDDKLGFALTQCLEGLAVAQDVFTGLDDQLQAIVDAFDGFFGSFFSC